MNNTDMDECNIIYVCLFLFQITERGTEAAAATSAFIFRMGPSKVMQFDRPFFLFIYDALNKVQNLLKKYFVSCQMNTFDPGCHILG